MKFRYRRPPKTQSLSLHTNKSTLSAGSSHFNSIENTQGTSGMEPLYVGGRFVGVDFGSAGVATGLRVGVGLVSLGGCGSNPGILSNSITTVSRESPTLL